jgi:hypothetical protein
MNSMRQRYLNQIFMRVPRRAENNDRGTLAATYVNAGSFSAMLHSTDHQVLYGRRGTGKTHALQHLSDLVERAGDLSVYPDLRTIGSTDYGTCGGDTSTAVRGTHLLVDVLEAIHDELFALAIEREGDLLESTRSLKLQRRLRWWARSSERLRSRERRKRSLGSKSVPTRRR